MLNPYETNHIAPDMGYNQTLLLHAIIKSLSHAVQFHIYLMRPHRASSYIRLSFEPDAYVLQYACECRSAPTHRIHVN